MLSRQTLLPALILALASCATAQAAEKKSSDASSPGLSDQDLDQRRANLDVKLANRTLGVKHGLDKIASYQLKAEKDRLDFERYIAEERKAFYLFLKSVRADERDKELDRFTDKQDKERQDFDKKQVAEQKDWFHETIEKPWKSESLELESGTAPAMPAESAPAPKEQAMAPAKKPAPAHKAVYKKKSKPAVKKKPKAEAAQAPAQAPAESAAQAPAEQPAAVPSATPDPGGADAPPPPPPGN